MEFTLLFAAGTAVVAAWVTNRLLGHRFPDWLEHPTDLLIGSAAVGMLIGRLAAMIADGVNPIVHPLDVLLVRAGVDTGWASVGALATLGWVGRRHLPELVDLQAPAALAALAGWHGGCLWRGTCLGTVTDLPWGMSLDGSAITRHPVGLYLALGLAIAAFLVSRLPAVPWIPSGAALAAASGLRLLTESLRPSVVGGPTLLYVAGLVLGAASVVFGWVRRRDETITA